MRFLHCHVTYAGYDVKCFCLLGIGEQMRICCQTIEIKLLKHVHAIYYTPKDKIADIHGYKLTIYPPFRGA